MNLTVIQNPLSGARLQYSEIPRIIQTSDLSYLIMGYILGHREWQADVSPDLNIEHSVENCTLIQINNEANKPFASFSNRH